MKVLFINCAYPVECKKELTQYSSLPLQAPVDTFQWAVIEGLERNGIDYTLACAPALPAWPRFKKLYTPAGGMNVNGQLRGHYLRFCNAPLLKQISTKRVLYKYAKKWCENNKKEDALFILVYSQQSEYLGAAINLKGRYKNLVVVPIITDLIECAMEYESNRGVAKRVQILLEQRVEKRLFKKVDKFVLLSKQMIECIPEAMGRFIVVEGITPQNSINPNIRLEKDTSERSLLYTGVLEEYAGIRLLVDAFRKVPIKNARLIICGSGTDASYVKSAATEDPRIDFRGQVEREEAVSLQKDSTLLINPRQPNGGITKYSFPSKTMEYMTSGTPMIGYHLEGIPEEYYKYMYSPNDLSEKALTECITKALSLTDQQLGLMSKEAYKFVVENKNSKAQIHKIISFMDESSN